VNRTVIHLHLVSEAAGGTLTLANRAASSLWPDVPIVEHLHPPLISRDLLRRILRDIERQPGIVLYSLSDPVAIRNLKEACTAIGCRAIAMPTPKGDAPGLAPDNPLNSALRLHLEPQPRARFRAVAGTFAGLLALQAMWSLSIALIHPTIVFPTADAAAARVAAGQRESAHAAALIGGVRGDLWANYAFALTSDSLGAFESAKDDSAPRGGGPARSVAKRAAELAPCDAKVWLLLAALDSHTGPNRDKVSEELRTSYYTGPNERALRPLRIRIAVASDAIADPELQSLVTQEIRTIVSREPGLKPEIVNAYQHGSADGKRFLERVLAELDPVFLNAMLKG
jgi:Kinase/pyrophosphorylase